MLRDFKFLRRNSGKNPSAEEVENVPVNPSDPLAVPVGGDTSRAPLNAIQDPSLISRPVQEPESGLRGKVERTPTRAKRKTPATSVPTRTPEKLGDRVSARSRFGWFQKNEPTSNVAEPHEDGRIDPLNNSSQLGRGVCAGNGLAANMTPRPTRTIGRANSNYSESNSTPTTPSKSVSKPLNPGLATLSSSRIHATGGARAGGFAALSKGFPVSSGPFTIVNTVEVPHFDLKEDPSFWMDHNVQVLIRVRPLNGMEKSMNGYSRCLKQETAQSITWIGQQETRFTFDHVASESIDQETLFRMAGLPMVENCLLGYNSCMFAYGQTGSGKTFTMLGEIEELEVNPSPNRGLTPRIFEFLFARIRTEEEKRKDNRVKYNCKCSFLEIYNEQITDLLDPSSTNLLLREDNKKGVYVENLAEFEVQTVGDILRLLAQGSSNRKVAATNMNRESSRSHSVFTCVIESRWEKDSTANLRFARLNLVDLAGSERQKSSGAEGERLREAANINKSLSTLGHVIMALVDVAHGKLKHVPYRDSRLTFLLQDSLGGNSKTMIIANVSPSVCCAAETLNTLKFAQRAKLIQNNAVVNEDTSGDVIALQHQIRLLKEELSVLKREKISRSLPFCSAASGDSTQMLENFSTEKNSEMEHQRDDDLLVPKSKNMMRLSSRQLKSLETTVAGALRREQMAEASIKQLEAEIEQLNRLVRQREEDTRSTKMMLKFREDKIQRMESYLRGSIPADTYLLEENRALIDEIQLLQAKIDRNPEITRFALENIRLLDQLRRFQDFYEEGEREILLAEISVLREQVLQNHDRVCKIYNSTNLNMTTQEGLGIPKEGDSIQLELKTTLEELDDCRGKLQSFVEENAKLSREVEDLCCLLNNLPHEQYDRDNSVNFAKEFTLKAPTSEPHVLKEVQEKNGEKNLETIVAQNELIHLQLELDILKIILNEERSARCEVEEKEMRLSRDLDLARGKILLIRKEHEEVNGELREAKSIIEALETQQVLYINEMEDLRNSKNNYVELLSKNEIEISSLKKQLSCQELRDQPPLKHPERENSPLQEKLKVMQEALEKAKRLNMWYQSDRAFHASNEEDMDEVRKQAEAETADAIVCLQEELAALQQQVEDSNLKDSERTNCLMLLENESKDLQEKLHRASEDNQTLGSLLEEKNQDLRTLSEEWEQLTSDINEILADGHKALGDASDQLDVISSSFPQKRTWISEQFSRMTNIISEKEFLIEELHQYMENINSRRNDVDCMLRSLKDATRVITEAHRQECSEKEGEILLLLSELNAKTSTITKLENRLKLEEHHTGKTSLCATAAFVIVNRLSEKNTDHLKALEDRDIQLSEAAEMNLRKDVLLCEQGLMIEESKKQIQNLGLQLKTLEETCATQRVELSEEQRRVYDMEQNLENTKENGVSLMKNKLDELKTQVSMLRLCMCMCLEQNESPENRTDAEVNQNTKNVELHFTEDLEPYNLDCSLEEGKGSFNSGRTCMGSCHADVSTLLLEKETESAIESFKRVQDQMNKLQDDKEDVWVIEKQSQENMKPLVAQAVAFQAAMSNFEKLFRLKMVAVDHQLQSVEQTVQEVGIDWRQIKEVLELDVGDAKITAAQKVAEASCALDEFEEGQETVKQADAMINKLLVANETMKHEIKMLKKMKVELVDERNSLITEVQSLQSANNLKDRQCGELEKQLVSSLTDTRNLVLELEDITALVQAAFEKDLLSISGEFHSIKSELLESTKSLRSWLEDIWSELIVKDCAMSALHLCHMGLLLETVTGLNAENGFLHHGLCESHAVISDLREHNVKCRRELDTCRIIKGKLLADMKNSFDRISKKEDETEELGIRMTTFEKKIMDLQLQEELMLQRSNYMGSQLAILIKELDLSNANVFTSIFDQEKLLKDKEDYVKRETEMYMVDLLYKDFESLIMASELEEMALRNAEKEREQTHFFAFLENLNKEFIFLNFDEGLKEHYLVDKEVEVSLLQSDRQNLLSNINQSSSKITQTDKLNKVLENEIQLLKDVACSNEKLKGELVEVLEAKERLYAQVHNLKSENEELVKELRMKEVELNAQNERLQDDICLLKASCYKLHNDLGMKDAEKKSLADEVTNLKTENHILCQDLADKKTETESSLSHINAISLDQQNLQGKVSFLEMSIASLQIDLEMRNAELIQLHDLKSVVGEELVLKSQDLDLHVKKEDALMEENALLKRELKSHLKIKQELLTMSNLNIIKCVDTVNTVDVMTSGLFNMLGEEKSTILEKMFKESCENLERASTFLEDFKCLEFFAKDLISENLLLQSELSRKDEVLKGLSFDLRLLQESASDAKDQKDEIEHIAASLEALEDELIVKSGELDEAVSHGHRLEAQLQEKADTISTLTKEILEQRAQIKDALAEKSIILEELAEKREINSSLEMDLTELGNSLEQMNSSIESLNKNLSAATGERDCLQAEMLILKEELDKARAHAEEIEAIAMEAQQMAEARRVYAEEKDKEVKLLERSVEELERTVDVLENKVDIVRGEAELQGLQREELELELHALKHQLTNVESGDSDIRRILDEKEKNVQEAQKHIQTLEREIAGRDAEISQCKAHISELYLHAEVQASEHKQKFKALEAMADQVRPEGTSMHVTSSTANKLERNSLKPRGSSSPFKCIGLGLANQIKSGKDEELTAGRLRIEELEALAASRQKEIFMLNTRLAAAESMTHDVIRDLLGVKLDMTNYMSLFDNQKLQKMTDKALIHSTEAVAKEEEVKKLKQQVNELIVERQSWLEEVDRKQTEMVALQVSLEKLHQKERLLTAENEMFKMENINHKKKVMELESAVNKLSGQQNLQQRIHHHAKIKEENNLLKNQNEDLSAKLKQAEAILSRVKKELAHYRAANGRCPVVDFDEEKRLNGKIKESEAERLQLAQKLWGLCTSILKAAGITRLVHDISLPEAEEALEQLKNKVTSLERELQDLKFQNRIYSERTRLSELMPETSPLSSRTDSNHQTSKRGSPPTIFSALDR